MTLLMTIFAAVISTVLWYAIDSTNKIKLGTLSLMYWGASLMWLVDAVFEYVEMGAEFFTSGPADMLNDTYLGISVTAFGLVIWLVILLINDPKGVISRAVGK